MYDEFGSILLFILTLQKRYDLSPYDLGIADGESFITRLIERGSVPKTPETMSVLENQHFSGWISSLYEMDGIIDDMMSSCSPQDFYLLVPTLFSQSLLACEKGVLDFPTLKGGLECRCMACDAEGGRANSCQICSYRHCYHRWLAPSPG